MQSFGLLGLLVVLGLAMWFFTAGPVAPVDMTATTTATQGNVLDKARNAASEMEQSTLEHSTLQ